MSDFVVMRKGAIMAVASPSVTSLAIRKPIDPEDLGGWKLLTGVSGLADLSSIPTSRRSTRSSAFCRTCRATHGAAAGASRAAGSDDACKNILELMPESRNQVYDVRKVIRRDRERGLISS